MKKLILFAFVVISAVSCEGPTGPMGPTGEPGAYWEVVDFDISDWDRDAENGFFLAHFSFPELTDVVYNDGIVMAYIEFDGTYQTPLPYTRYRGEPDDSGVYLWSELLDFEYAPGEITFYSTPSDFNTIAETPDPALIRVVLLW